MKLLILATDSVSTNIIYSYLSRHFEVSDVIIENKVSKKTFLTYRYKKLGLIKFMDQLLFLLIANKVLRFFVKSKISKLLLELNLDSSNIPKEKICKVSSINSSVVSEKIIRINPDFIIVSGTRIISKNILNSTNIKFINIHAGITPTYRGVHGAYWALVEKSKNLVGVTVHFLDAGVDTGVIISHKLIETNSNDNILTYPVKQLSEGLIELNKYLESVENNSTYFPNIINVNISKQWFHPGGLQYLYNRIIHGVK